MGITSEDFESLKAPTTIEGLGVSPGLVEDYFMRRLFNLRSATITTIAQSLAIASPVGNKIAENLREKKLLEYQGLEGRDYLVTLTERGYAVTAERMKYSKHVGEIPITLSQYQLIVELQKADVHITRESVKTAFADLVTEDSLLDQVGPAFIGDGAIFLYGPPGTGKTSIAEQLGNIYQDHILIPRYVETDGQIISVYDPALHTATTDQPTNLDPRFVVCERPLLLVGGELTLPMLELQYDSISGINTAPIQMLANNGILVIDDFGRQTFSPDAILNRWIVPLTRGIDFLKPKTGNKISVPFELKLVFSTNLEPHRLGDEAFLRRLKNKVYVGPCSKTVFEWILIKAAKRENIEMAPEASQLLIDITRNHLNELRPYIAVDFCQLARTICEYDHSEVVMDKRTIHRIADLYFVHTTAQQEQEQEIQSAPEEVAQQGGQPTTTPPQPDFEDRRRPLYQPI